MADILIRGMEMPTEQRMEVLIFKNGFVAYYNVYGHYLGQAKATQLPEEHGRLIDADALKTTMDDCIYSDRDRFSTGYAKSFIDDATTIVPAEGGLTNENHR